MADPLTTLRVSYAVQHHPSRADRIPDLVAALAPADVEIVTDPDPGGGRNAWRTYQAALAATPAGATHRLIVQDDAEPVPSFTPIIERAITARPDTLLVLFVSQYPKPMTLRVLRAGQRGECWADANPAPIIPTVALVWPTGMIADFLAWDEAQNYPRQFTADDEHVGRYVRAHHTPCLVTVPNLIEHPDTIPSVGRGGQPAHRTSCCPPPDGCDLLALDWV